MKALLSLILVAASAFADQGSWQNLTTLEAGQKIEVSTRSGATKGTYVRHDAATITLREAGGERSIPQSDVTRVEIPKRKRAIWIGAIIGGVTGVIVGSALGTRLSNESGGDFAGSKPAITGATAAGGVALGAAIGAAVRRPSVVYRKP